MSVITNVYTALKAKLVTTTSGKTPTVYGLNELPENITTSQLPCRLLLPVGCVLLVPFSMLRIRGQRTFLLLSGKSPFRNRGPLCQLFLRILVLRIWQLRWL